MHLVTAFLLFLLPLANAGAVTADEWVQKADSARYPNTQLTFKVTVHDHDDSDSKESTYLVSAKDARTSLVDQVAPERSRGRKLLLKNYDMWMYTPNMKRATRISMEQKLTGEVSNGDLARTNFSEDYNATVLSEDKTTIDLELVAKTKEVTYRKIHYTLEKPAGTPMKAQFFALSGKLLKEAIYSELKPELGVKLIHKIVITDALQKSKTSELTYFDFKKTTFSDAKFSKESLDQD